MTSKSESPEQAGLHPWQRSPATELLPSCPAGSTGMRGGNADPSVCSACRGRRLRGTAQHQPVATSPPSVPSQLQQTTGKNANYSLVPSSGGKAGGARTRKEMGAGAERRAGRRELKPSAGTPGSILCCGETPGSRERVGRGSPASGGHRGGKQEENDPESAGSLRPERTGIGGDREQRSSQPGRRWQVTLPTLRPHIFPGMGEARVLGSR